MTVMWMVVAFGVAQASPAVPEVEDLQIISVVDNTYDCFQPDEAVATRHSLAHTDGFDSIRLTAEMGLAYVIRYKVAGKPHTILFDFGLTQLALENNLKKLNIPLQDVEALILSHAHEDHYAGLAWAAAQTHAPIYVGNADAFLPRQFETPKRSWSMGTLDRAALVAAGSRVVEVATPTVVAGGALVSGTIAQATPYEKVPPFLRMMKDGKMVQDPMTHELALGFRVKGKGLVVVTACAHAGVINSTLWLQKASGETRLHAVLGGMHLTSAPPDVTDATVAALVSLKPAYVAPLHCTGDRAMRKLAATFGSGYVQPSAGTAYHF